MDSITTRIDLQKLQLLNDRICQTLDALAQVRLSAHNTSLHNMYSPYMTAPSVPAYGMGVGFGQALPVNPYINGGFNLGWNGLNHFGFPQFVNPWQVNRPGFNTVAPMFAQNGIGATTFPTNSTIPAAACGVTQGFAPVAW